MGYNFVLTIVPSFSALIQAIDPTAGAFNFRKQTLSAEKNKYYTHWKMFPSMFCSSLNHTDNLVAGHTTHCRASLTIRLAHIRHLPDTDSRMGQTTGLGLIIRV